MLCDERQRQIFGFAMLHRLGYGGELEDSMEDAGLSHGDSDDLSDATAELVRVLMEHWDSGAMLKMLKHFGLVNTKGRLSLRCSTSSSSSSRRKYTHRTTVRM